jgi:predicted histidine transporter YuiF (NhaC family)
MTDKDLGRALLALDADKLAGSDTRQQTWQILERDRRRVWWLTAVTIMLWAAAILMVFGMLVAFGLVFPLQAKLRDPAELARIPPEMRQDAQFKAQIAFQMVTVGVTCSVGILALAALATILLVLATRRATLRQINASLLEISQQLKDLRQAPPQ